MGVDLKGKVVEANIYAVGAKKHNIFVAKNNVCLFGVHILNKAL